MKSNQFLQDHQGAKLKVNSFKCDHCGKTLTIQQVLRLKWEKQKKHVDVCPDCFANIYQKQMKSINRTELDANIRGTKLYKEGARAIDFLSYLEKWIKKKKSER